MRHFPACEKGSQAVLFLFLCLGSCISASHFSFSYLGTSFFFVLFLFKDKAYEHCHLVVISEAQNTLAQVGTCGFEPGKSITGFQDSQDLLIKITLFLNAFPSKR